MTVYHRAKAALYLIFLTSLFPVVSLFTFLYLVMANLFKSKRGKEEKEQEQEEGHIQPRRSVLVTGAPHTKVRLVCSPCSLLCSHIIGPQYKMKRSLQGLEMCRLLSSAGHSVTLSDMDKFKFSAARFSRSVDRWVSLPDVTPRSVLPYKVELRMSESSTVHMIRCVQEALKDLIRRERFDWWIPVSHTETAVLDVEVKVELERENCSVNVLAVDDGATAEMLDDKCQFLTEARNCQLNVPDFYRVSSCDEVMELALKGLSIMKNLSKTHFCRIRRFYWEALLPEASRSLLDRSGVF